MQLSRGHGQTASMLVNTTLQAVMLHHCPSRALPLGSSCRNLKLGKHANAQWTKLRPCLLPRLRDGPMIQRFNLLTACVIATVQWKATWLILYQHQCLAEFAPHRMVSEPFSSDRAIFKPCHQYLSYATIHIYVFGRMACLTFRRIRSVQMLVVPLR